MAISVNQDVCIGCGACVNTCPQAFKLNDAGKSEVVSQEPVDCAQAAADGCPVQAITVS